MSKSKVQINFINTNIIKSLKSDETIKLIKEYQKTKDLNLKDEVALGNIKLVLSVVNRFNKRYDNLDDLFQIGFLGLLKSIDNFNPELNVAFSTYAVPMIEGEIKRYLRDDSPLKVSRQVKDLSYKVLKAKEQSMFEFGAIPSIEELASSLNEEKARVVEAMDVHLPLLSFEEPLSNDIDDTLLLQDTIASVDEDRKKEYSYLYEGMEHLNEMEKKIINLRYYKGMSQIEIAKEFNISQAQVSRIEKQALLFLKKYVQ